MEPGAQHWILCMEHSELHAEEKEKEYTGKFFSFEEIV